MLLGSLSNILFRTLSNVLSKSEQHHKTQIQRLKLRGGGRSEAIDYERAARPSVSSKPCSVVFLCIPMVRNKLSGLAESCWRADFELLFLDCVSSSRINFHKILNLDITKHTYSLTASLRQTSVSLFIMITAMWFPRTCTPNQRPQGCGQLRGHKPSPNPHPK